ncbi:MAG: serine/threonine-protein phosphatase [Ardenticatenaceae bacterium]|nr:serine/threonine-protein phosphatase [Ardenticatenaceae bacterium]
MKNYDHRLIGAASDTGPVRKANEDAFFIPQPTDPTHLGALYIVADGVGGQEHGAAASELAVRVAAEAFYQARQRGEAIQAALKFALLQANTAVYDEAQARGGGRMGCTIVAAVQDDGLIYVAHVGDARAYMVHDKRLRRMTRDDTWVQKQVEAGLITTEQAANHELRNVVTQVLGNKMDIEVHLSRPYTLQPYDILLLCSDGLYDAVPVAEIEMVLTEQSALAAAESLIKTAVSHEASDNITAVVVRCGEIAGVANRRSRPKWLPWLALAALVLVALALLLPRLLSGNDVPEEGTAPTTAAPTPLPAVNDVPTVTVTAVPQATSTIAPTMTNTPPPTETAVPTATPAAMACVLFDSTFVWTDAQLDNSDCDQFASEAFTAGTQVQVLQLEARTVAGPDAACIENQFRKVRSVSEPEIEGWVLDINLGDMPETGCEP